MKKLSSMLILFSLLACNAEQTNVFDLMKRDKVIDDSRSVSAKHNACGDTITVKSSPIKTITQSHNRQKELDIQNQQHILDVTLNRKITEILPDGTTRVTETTPSNVTIEALNKRSNDFKTLDDATTKAGFALLLFKALGGL
jgi:hypothetical protein